MDWIRSVATVVAIGLVAGCTTLSREAPVAQPPQPGELHLSDKRPRIVFVLSSGGSRGTAHAGVLDVLGDHGIFADAVVGTSVGALVGAFYAGGIRGDALVRAALAVDLDSFRDWAAPNRGVVAGRTLRNFVNGRLGGRLIEELQLPFAAVATNLDTQERAVFVRGDTGQAVRASSSVPGLFKPVTIDGQDHVDGAVISPVAVDVARNAGADIVIAVDVSKPPRRKPELKSTWDVLRQTQLIRAREVARPQLANADVVIRPHIRGKINTLSDREGLITAGKKAALAAVPKIRALIANFEERSSRLLKNSSSPFSRREKVRMRGSKTKGYECDDSLTPALSRGERGRSGLFQQPARARPATGPAQR